VAEDSKDKLSGAQDATLGSSKDVLFGWLVRRAAADLGLAEAIAASEAQRTEQIKRLEDSLLAKVQELQSQPSGGMGITLPVAEVQDLKTQIQRLSARMGALEVVSQQADQTGESLTAKLEALGRDIGDREERLAARCSSVDHTAGTVLVKIQALEEQVRAQPPAAEDVKSALGEFQVQLQSVAERIAQLESASAIAAAAEIKAERARWTAEFDERTTARIRELGDEIREKLKAITSLKTELEAGRSDAAALGERVAEVERSVRQFSTEVKAEISAQRIALGAEQSRLLAGENFLKEVDQRLGARISGVESAVHEKLPGIEGRFGELAALREQSLALSERVAELGSRADRDAAQALAQAQRAQTQEDAVAAKLGAIASQLKDQLHVSESRGVELGRLGVVVRDLVERMGKVEFAAQQFQAMAAAEEQRAEHSARRFDADLTALKAELADQLKNLATPQALIQGLESTIGIKFQEFQNELAHTRRGAEARDEQYREIGRELQTLAQRLAEAESVAHQTHALMINESEQSGQRREVLRSEFDALRAQLNQASASDVLIRGIEENFNLKIREMESQLAERMRQWDHREAEFREIRTQVQSLSQGVPRAAGTLPVSADPAPSVVVPMDINSLRTRREEIGTASRPSAERPAAVPTTESPGDVSLGVGISGGNKEQLRQLQERISADIERARAELREKSGRWRAQR
jgi:chromosome segregation ATPase